MLVVPVPGEVEDGSLVSEGFGEARAGTPLALEEAADDYIGDVPSGPELGAAIGEAAVAEASPASPSVRLPRIFSKTSADAMHELRLLEDQLAALESSVAAVDERVRGPGGVLDPVAAGKVKTELAQLESQAHKLESAGVDNIYTGDLASGKASVKEAKREQLRRLEALFTKIEGVFFALPKSVAA